MKLELKREQTTEVFYFVYLNDRSTKAFYAGDIFDPELPLKEIKAFHAATEWYNKLKNTIITEKEVTTILSEEFDNKKQ